MKRLALLTAFLALAAACDSGVPQRQGSNEGSAAQSAAGASSNEGRAARSAGSR